MQEKIIENIKKIIYYAIPLGLIIIYISTAFNNCIWLDEAFSMSMIQQNFGEIIYNTAIDVHPPLYYIILKVLVNILGFILGNDIWAAKIVSIIPIIILMLVSDTLIKKMYGKKVSFLFKLLILSVPQIMNYAIEIRMYTWGLLFVTLFYLYCIKWKREDKKIDLILMSLFAILAAYTHYFALVPVVGLYLCIFVETLIHKDKTKIKKLFLSILICCIAYIPWIIVWFKQVMAVKESYWISAITWETFKSYLEFPFKITGNKIFACILIILLLISIILLYKNRKEKENNYYLFGLLTPVFTILLGVIASKILRPIFISRYIVCSLGVLWLSVAILLGKHCNKKYIFLLLSSIIFIIGTTKAYNLVKIEQQYNTEVNKSQSYLNTISDSIFIFDDNQIQRVIAYYYPETQTYLYNQEITDLTRKVYRQTHMDIIDNLEKIKEMEGDVYLFITDKQTLNDLDSFEYQLCGTYKIERYKFSIYMVKK